MIAAPLGGAWKRESPIHSLFRRLPLKEKVQCSLSLFLIRSAEKEETEDGKETEELSKSQLFWPHYPPPPQQQSDSSQF